MQTFIISSRGKKTATARRQSLALQRDINTDETRHALTMSRSFSPTNTDEEWGMKKKEYREIETDETDITPHERRATNVRTERTVRQNAVVWKTIPVHDSAHEKKAAIKENAK